LTITDTYRLTFNTSGKFFNSTILCIEKSYFFKLLTFFLIKKVQKIKAENFFPIFLILTIVTKPKPWDVWVINFWANRYNLYGYLNLQ